MDANSSVCNELSAVNTDDMCEWDDLLRAVADLGCNRLLPSITSEGRISWPSDDCVPISSASDRSSDVVTLSIDGLSFPRIRTHRAATRAIRNSPSGSSGCSNLATQKPRSDPSTDRSTTVKETEMQSCNRKGLD